MSFASGHNDHLDPERSMRMDEDAEIGKCVQALLDALKEYPDQGRNQECWPLYSFGWKDADLDEAGCTGIREVVRATEDGVTLLVGGHKTLCDPTYEPEWELDDEDGQVYSNVAHEIVCGQEVGKGEWDGDSWFLSWKGEITVEWPAGDLDAIWKEKMVERVLQAAREAIEPFEKDMVRLSNEMDVLYQELDEKYREPVPCPEWS